MESKSFRISFYSGRKFRRFGWFSIILSVAANVLIFFSISWVNRTSSVRPEYQDYGAIEVFKPKLIPEKILPVIDSIPVVTATRFQPKPEPMKPSRAQQPLLRPRLVEWMPDSLLKQPGVAIDISLADIDTSELLDTGNINDALALNQVDNPPQRISGASPVYPLWAKTNRDEGAVTLRFIVDIDGKVHDIGIHSIDCDGRFAKEATKAVAKWRFKPAIDKAMPVAVWCFQKIHFEFEY
jgi:protein TonB